MIQYGEPLRPYTCHQIRHHLALPVRYIGMPPHTPPIYGSTLFAGCLSATRAQAKNSPRKQAKFLTSGCHEIQSTQGFWELAIRYIGAPQLNLLALFKATKSCVKSRSPLCLTVSRYFY